MDGFSDLSIALIHPLIACINFGVRAGLHCVPHQLGGEDGEASASE
jgi:hypothetical protein